ncbi:MAG: hypothetical protein LR011_05695 [Verrucomicrobia bacterium]|nr:hypothetical protein [Verrucomicrobiota bacterium]
MASGDGQFLLLGEGFDWDINLGLIGISKHIKTILTPQTRPLGTETTAGDKSSSQASSPSDVPGFVGHWKEIQSLTITADQVRYDIQKAMARYQGQVKASDPAKITTSSRILDLQLRPGAGGLDQIVMSDSVQVDLKQNNRTYQVESGQAIYQVLGEGQENLIFSKDSPRWKSLEAHGSGDTLSFFLPEKRVEVVGRAQAHIGVPTEIIRDFQSATGQESVFGPTLDIFAASYFYVDNRLEISDVREMLSGSSRMTTTSITLELDENMQASRLSAGPEFQLTGQMRLKPFQIRGNGLMVRDLAKDIPVALVESDAGWEWDTHRGGSQEMEFRLSQFHLVCRNRAWVELRSEVLTAPIQFNLPTRIDCQQYSFISNTVSLTGSVVVRHPQWQMEAQEVAMVLNQASRKLQSMQASGEVHLQSLIPGALTDPGDPVVQRILGGLLEEGIPWNLTSQTLSLDIDPDTELIDSFEASGGVRLERGNNIGLGGLLSMPTRQRIMELSIDPVFRLESGMQWVGRGDAKFLWNLDANKFSVQSGNTGSYKIQLPKSTISEGLKKN